MLIYAWESGSTAFETLSCSKPDFIELYWLTPNHLHAALIVLNPLYSLAFIFLLFKYNISDLSSNLLIRFDKLVSFGFAFTFDHVHSYLAFVGKEKSFLSML